MHAIAICPPLRWTVARTMARSEKRLLTWCEQLEIVAYLPLRRSVRRYQRRTVTTEIPIFAGYLFVQLEPERRHLVAESRYAASLLIPDEKMEVQLVEELRALQLLSEATDAGELVVRPEIEVGKAVTITTGPLSGLQGTVLRRKQQTRLAVNINMIGQSVSVELDVGEVEME